MASKRPKGWVPDKDIQKKIEETLKDPKRKFSKKAIEKLQKEEKEKATGRSQSQSTDTDELAAFTTTLSVYSASEPSSQYALASSFILDSGATVHVCNNCTRFQNLRPAHDDDRLLAGKDTILIEGFGSVEIIVERESGQRRITLENTAWVPRFHTSVVSLRKFLKRNVH